MGLTQKILLFASALVVALVATSLAFTTYQADRLARENVAQGLTDTRQVWETYQADRFNKLKLGIRVLGNDPYFKAVIETDAATILDTLRERNQELKADFFIVTDPSGVVIARTDRPGVRGEDLSKDPLVQKPLEGEEAATVWRQGDRLFHAVSVPMITDGDLKGVLIAGFAINEALAADIRKLTHSEIVYLTHAPGQPARVSVSSLGPKETALVNALGRDEFAAANTASLGTFEMDLDGDRHVGIQVPLKAATGDVVGLADRPAQHGRGDGGVPAVPAQPGAGVAGGDGPRPRRGLRRGVAHHRPRAGAGGHGRARPQRLVRGQGAGGQPGRDRRPRAHLQQPARRPAREGAPHRLPARRHDDDEEGRPGHLTVGDDRRARERHHRGGARARR